MRPIVTALILGLLGAGSARAQGLLLPTEKSVAPLALVSHEVTVDIEDQAAVTKVVQTFRNHTNRALEATYVFPVPKGASVKKFVMWVDGKEVPGELVEADKARAIYTDIVRRTQDPGLLEYLGNNLLKVRVFPVPASGEQKLAVSYTSLAQSDNGLIEYIYPLKVEIKNRGLEKFTLSATLKAQQPIQNVYSPTHAIAVRRPNDREAVVSFEGKNEALDKDFQLYYTATAKDVGLTTLTHRPSADANGHFMLLISPRAELSQIQQAPRDMVFVLDTSGSMQGKRIVQARNALKYCLRNLNANDRFALIHFASSVTKYKDNLLAASESNTKEAQRWVDGLEATGATNIDEALATALAMRSGDSSRTLTIVFFTDGEPTVGEINPQNIVKNVVAKNTANTRIFTFGVGDDVNAVLLDQLAEKTRSVSTYVRESEDIEAKVSNFYGKISHPVLTNLKLKVDGNVAISEIYPPQLPDLFHGSQLVVLGRYKPAVETAQVRSPLDVMRLVVFGRTGQESAQSAKAERGPATVTLTGMVGNERKEFTYEVQFARETGKDKAFVEDLWARRKVGYLLDQIRTNGENKELRGEVITLAKKYGITTPYTSYLVVPDAAPVTAGRNAPSLPLPIPPAFKSPYPTIMPPNFDWTQYYRNHGYQNQINSGPTASSGRVQFAPVQVAPNMNWAVPTTSGTTSVPPVNLPSVPGSVPSFRNPYELPGAPASPPASAYDTRDSFLRPTEETKLLPSAQTGKQGVDLAQQLSEMRNQERVGRAAVRLAAGRKCLDINGVWTDERVDAKLPVVKLKAQSEAYFRMLERQPQMREVFQLGNRVVWVTPSRTVLVIGPNAGEERMSDADIDRLFVAPK